MKNWKTTLFGALAFVASVAPVLHGAGIQVGHWGTTDFTQVAAGVSTLLLGMYAKDSNVTGGNVKQ